MSDDLERLLGAAFDAQAHAAVPGSTPAPAPRFERDEPGTVLRPHRRRRLVAPLLAAAAVVAAVAVGIGVTGSGDHAGTAAGHHALDTQGLTAPRSATRAAADAQPVHVSLHMDEGQTYGVGMPVIAYFSRAITDARSFQQATTVTVDGRPIDAEWYFEPSKAGFGPLEAHLRPQSYWPAHARIRVAIASAGLTAGRGVGFDNSLTMDFRTGAYVEVRVVAAAHRLTVYRDHNPVFHCPVALGAPATPTMRGTKVIMQRNRTVTVDGTGSAQSVQYAQRLSYSGEYLLGASWLRSATLGKPGSVQSSSGSTDMTAADASKVWGYTRVGDVVTYPDSSGPAMKLGLGYGDWTVPWTEWRTGGAVPTH